VTTTLFFWKSDHTPTLFPSNLPLSEPPLKHPSNWIRVANAVIRLHLRSRLLARSNRRGAPQASTSRARARGFCPLLWSCGPRPSNGLRSHTRPVPPRCVVGESECRRKDTPAAVHNCATMQSQNAAQDFDGSCHCCVFQSSLSGPRRRI
jgi:hypothetical protein